jgi:putative transposase
MTTAERLHRVLQRPLRDELLNETLFTSLTQARVALGCWRVDYNDARPHSQLGWKTQSEFAITCHP